jgi:hypothetical protein
LAWGRRGAPVDCYSSQVQGERSSARTRVCQSIQSEKQIKQ